MRNLWLIASLFALLIVLPAIFKPMIALFRFNFPAVESFMSRSPTL